jgi:two-component system CitB family sensor kinase
VREGKLIGAVSSFRRKDELAELSAQLSQVQAYSDLLRVQTHEHNNQLGTIAGLIELGATRRRSPSSGGRRPPSRPCSAS